MSLGVGTQPRSLFVPLPYYTFLTKPTPSTPCPHIKRRLYTAASSSEERDI